MLNWADQKKQKKSDKMSEMKLIMERWDKYLVEEPIALNTYGDLRKQLEMAKSAKNKDDFKSFGLGLAMDFAGISTIKSGIDLIKGFYSLPDDKKTNSVLDTFLNVDDQVSAIVDDTVENAFLSDWLEYVKNQDADRLLGDDNVTERLLVFLADKYKGRTIDGVPST